MQGIILAAGRGSRMKKLSYNNPKSLIKYKKKTFLEHVINNFKKNEIKNIVIITGYKSEKFKKFKCKKIKNKLWKTSNIFFSLYQARHILKKEECIISYADIFYKPSAIKIIKNSKSPISILSLKYWKKIWKSRFNNPLIDLESFSYDKSKNLLDIGSKVKNINNIKGQYSGIFKITPEGWKLIEQLVDKKGITHYQKKDMTFFFKELIATNNKIIKVIDYSNFWHEIDTLKDLKLLN